MKSLRIKPVETVEDQLAFVALPWKIYRDDPYWVPPLPSQQKELLDPALNPFFEHATVDLYLARRGDETVGTIATFINHAHNQFHDENIGFFGFFEVLSDEEAAEALLATAENWARDQGLTALRGPAQFSTNEECGLLVDGFEDSPRILMTYNPRRYVSYFENFGYQKAMDLWAHTLDTTIFDGGSQFPKKLIRVVEKIKARGKIRVRNLDLKHFDDEVERVMKLYNNSWEGNWGFVPVTKLEAEKLAKDLRLILDPDLVFVAEVNGETVGFSLTLPDLNEPLRLAYPRLGVPEWWTLLKFAWHWKLRKRVDWLRVYALGVLPEYRVQGVDALLYIETVTAAMAKGFHNIEMSWVLETNEMMNRSIRMMGGQIYKTYRLYEKGL